ncbi:MAG: hypothetical protein ACRBBM_11000 [Pseudomonadaceae bacterium]|jgi:hypothetical protein
MNAPLRPDTAAAKKAPLFVPFNASPDSSPLPVIGYRADAEYLELVNEADLRSYAAEQLLNIFSCLDDYEDFSKHELSGAFLAIKFLTLDAQALNAGAHQCWARERKGRAAQ